jgi:hypothetical protein
MGCVCGRGQFVASGIQHDFVDRLLAVVLQFAQQQQRERNVSRAMFDQNRRVDRRRQEWVGNAAAWAGWSCTLAALRVELS